MRRQEWEIKQLLHGNRLANSGKLRLDGDALLMKKVNLRNSEEIRGNKKGKISESDPTIGGFN